MRHRIYVASSWKNKDHPEIVDALKEKGHCIYDYRAPHLMSPFSWSDIDAAWRNWKPQVFLQNLQNHPLARNGFMSDFIAMKWADTCVLLEPSGRSSHLEAGWFAGMNKTLIVYIPKDTAFEPELMLKMATHIVTTKNELLQSL